MDEMTATEPIKIATGNYKGNIVNIEFRKVNFQGKDIEYMDVFVNVVVPGLETTPQLKFGVSPNSSTGSKFMQLLKKFTEVVQGTTKVNEQFCRATLIGKSITFDVINKPSEKDKTISYANIVPETIKKV